MNKYNTSVLLTLLLISLSATYGVKNLKVVSPLKALTIWDAEAKEVQSTPRSKFLPKFRARLKAEAEARKTLKEKVDKETKGFASISGDNWASNAAIAAGRRRRAQEKFIEDASDRAASEVEASSPAKMMTKKNPNKYQFVGVINPQSSGKPIKWHARKKPAGAKWSVRLVHVDQAAVVTDLFRRGEVDIFAKYKNTAKVNEETNTPIVESEYSVRERSIK